MTLRSEVGRAALDQALRNAPRRSLCKVLGFQPDTPGGPTVVCVPYSRIDESRNGFPDTPAGEDSFRSQYARQLWVSFPVGQRFAIDPDVYDVYADAPFHRARECYPVMKAGARQRDYQVPDGITSDEASTPPVDPGNIRARIRATRAGLASTRPCDPDEPRYPRPHDIWNGPIRHDLDRARAEVWGAPKKLIARLDRGVTDFLTELPRFPLAAGTSVVWRDRREHPFQQFVGSSAALPYRRFIWSLVDPGYIVGVYKALRRYLEGLDRGVARHVTVYESVDLGTEIRED